MFNSTDRDGRIFRDEIYLTSSFKPEKPVGRTEEIERIASTLRRLRHNKTPTTLLLHGPAGLGKTTCVSYVLDQLSEQSTVKTIWINCWQYNTRPALLTELLIQLGYPAPRKGKPVDELLSKIREWLTKNNSVVVALDEFDQLNDKTEIIYDLHLVSQEASNPLGLIMLSNQGPDHLDLEPRSQSRLNYRKLKFQPYTQDELFSILQDRIEQAFHPGTVTQESIELIAQHAEEIGDCRKALALLLRAGQRAEEEGIKEVTPRMVQLEINDV